MSTVAYTKNGETVVVGGSDGGITNVTTDSTLKGNGTPVNPLGVANSVISNITNAQTTANSALAAAQDAKSTADDALGVAGDAIQDALEAHTAADHAQDSADNLALELADEKTNRENADSDLEAAINQEISDRQIEDQNLQDAIDEEKSAREENDISDFTYDGDTHTLVIETNGGNQFPAELPVATETEDGLMPYNDHETIYDNVARIEALENQTSSGSGGRVWYQNVIGQNFPSATDLYSSTSYTTQTLEVGMFARVLADSTQGGAVTEYTISNISDTGSITWQFSGALSNMTPQATQTTLGTVKGSTTAGKGYVESDGEISLNGYDALTTGLTTAQNDINSIKGNYVKLASSTTQIVDSNIAIGFGKELLAEESDGGAQHVLAAVKDYSGYVQNELANETNPTCINHAVVATDGQEVGKNILVNYVDSDGTEKADKIAYLSDITPLTWDNISGKPNFGTAALADVTDFATASQMTTANTNIAALQAIVTSMTNAEIDTHFANVFGS